MGDSDPELNDRDQSSNNRCPKANQEEYRQTCPNDLGKHQWREGCSREIDDPESNEQEGGQNSLKQQSYTGPAAGEGRKKSLQRNLPSKRREIAAKPERLKAGGADPTFGGDPTR